jgi:hypothetical protein
MPWCQWQDKSNLANGSYYQFPRDVPEAPVPGSLRNPAFLNFFVEATNENHVRAMIEEVVPLRWAVWQRS